LTQLTPATFCTVIGTAVPDTFAPLDGAVICTMVGTGVGVAVGPDEVGVAVGAAFATVTVIDAVPSTVLVAENPVTEIVCAPLDTVVEFQLNVIGGVDAR
jgi:hypothetical protein